MNAQMTQRVELISVPGYVTGKIALLNGQVVPAIVPEQRGMYSWSVPTLIEAVAGIRPLAAEETARYDQKTQDIGNFLDRVYYEIRNLGLAPQERAMNYAATNAFQVQRVFETAINADMKLDSIGVERSPICRPGSDCWDVKLTFFNPSKRLEQARHVYRFTVDVSDVIPVTVGMIRHWDVY
jgi:cyanobactin maturation PatA/PatG family protease